MRMQIALFEDESRYDLLPLTFTRPLAELRVGILSLRQKWEYELGAAVTFLTEPYLAAQFGSFNPDADTLLINGKFFPGRVFANDLRETFSPGVYFVNREQDVVAACIPAGKGHSLRVPLTQSQLADLGLREEKVDTSSVHALRRLSDIFQMNAREIRTDFDRLTRDRKSAGIPDTAKCTVFGKENIYAEEGLRIRAAILNAEDGPIYFGRNVTISEGAILNSGKGPMYIGNDVTIQEGAIIHGTHALCDHSTVNMGAKLRGDSTVGPWCKVGGEISNSVIMGYSNKGHDGFLGNSVIGWWCNLGADTNTSNLKNNYAEVKLWNYRRQRFERTGTQFCGLVMGDHSKCGINTMFNTGTVVGVSANVFGDGYPRNFIPDFAWGGAAGFITFGFDKAAEVVREVMKRRNLQPSGAEMSVLRHVFDLTAMHRPWEKGNTENSIA